MIFKMGFNTIKKESLLIISVVGLTLLLGCTKEEDTDAIRQHYQADELNIDAIEISPKEEFASRHNINTQFEAYGLLADAEDDVADQTITDKVIWSLNEGAVSKISQNGLFTSAKVNEQVTVTATFVDMVQSVIVNVTDSPLFSITIDEVDSVDVCRNLDLTARGILTDGFEVPLENDSLVWTTNETTHAEFKKDTVATLSTYLAGSVEVTATDRSNDEISSTVSIAIQANLITVTLDSADTMTSGETLAIKAMGEYADSSVDITENTTFLSRDTELATFAAGTNVLTAKANVANEASVEVDITGACNAIEGMKSITIMKPAL